MTAVADMRAAPAAALPGGAWRRLLRDRLAFAAAVLLVAVAMLALLAPVLATHDPSPRRGHSCRRSGLRVASRTTCWAPTGRVGTC